jgi:catechol 2,3-dioxygenase-like lactoylglutathione lyase family enzyme
VKVDLDHTVVTVSDWERSNAFYRDVLGAEVVPRGPVVAYRFGDRQLNVHGPGFDAFPQPLLPVAPGNSDICFVWEGPIEAAVAHLAACGVAVELGPAPREGARGIGTSVYFRDPDRYIKTSNPVEIGDGRIPPALHLFRAACLTPH